MSPEVSGNNSNVNLNYSWNSYSDSAEQNPKKNSLKPNDSIFASLDKNESSSVELAEAKSKVDAGFKLDGNKIINEIGNKYGEKVKTSAFWKGLPKDSIQNMYNKYAAAFKAISYTPGSSSEEIKAPLAPAQQRIDALVDTEINNQITGFNAQAKQEYSQLITKAMEEAKAELASNKDKDVSTQNKSETTSNSKGKMRELLSGGNYTVKKGDNLTKIAKAHGTTAQAIAELNGINLNDIIYPGDSLKIPGANKGSEANPIQLPEVVVIGDKSKEKTLKIDLASTMTPKAPELDLPKIDMEPLRGSMAKASLKEQGAKFIEREVNGEQREIAVYHNSEGEKVRQVVNDDGTIENLVATSTLGKNKYITQTEANKELTKLFGPDVANILIENGGIPVYQDGKITAVKVNGKEMTGSELNKFVRSQVEEKPSKPSISQNERTNAQLSEEEVNNYLENDETYAKRLDFLNNLDSQLAELEKKHNIDRNDSFSSLNIIGTEDSDTYTSLSLNYDFYNDMLPEFKETIRTWQDTPQDADVSNSFFRRNTTEWHDVRKETLPDGTKVYNTREGYFNLWFDGGPGERMTEEELKKHGLE